MLDKFYKSFKVFICFFLIFNTTLLSFSLDSKADTITGDIVGTGTGSATVEVLRKILGDTGVAQLGIVVGGSYLMAKTDEYVINPFLDLVKTGVQKFTPGTLTGILDGFKFKNTGISEFVLNAKGIESILNFMLDKSGTDYATSDDMVSDGSFFSVNDIYNLKTGDKKLIGTCVSSVSLSGQYIQFHSVVNGTYNLYAHITSSFSPGDVISFYATRSASGSGKPVYGLTVERNGVSIGGYSDVYTNEWNGMSVKYEISSIDGFSYVSNIGTVNTYPSDFSKYQSIDDYNSLHDAYTGSPSICVDWDKLLKDQDLTNLRNIDDVIGALEGVISSPGGADVLGQSISLEYDGVVVPDTPEVTEDDSNPSLLKKLMDWLFDLFKKLAELLEKLLKKMLEGLKELLLSLFVPSDSFLQENVDILKNNLEPKLPYTQFIELFNNDYDGSPLDDIYIHWNGQDIAIVKVTLFEKFRDVFNWGVYAVTFFLLAVYNYNNIYKLIRGTDYVSATGTVKNMFDEGSDKK